jgi:hypothetical protein
MVISAKSREPRWLVDRPLILKVHGSVSRRNADHDSFVITEDDYVEYVIRAGDNLNRVFPADVLAKARTSHFLFLGYSLRDWNLRVILNRIDSGRAGSYESWSVQRSSSDLDAKAWKARGVEVINMSLEAYVSSLRAAMDQVANEGAT